MQIIFGFVYKYIFEAIAVFLFVIVTKYLLKQFGNERTEKIKDAVLVAMLYAEETIGIGHGDEKWSQAWQIIVKLLQEQGIKLSEKEINNTTILMKSTVPEVNQIVYSSLSNEIKSTRPIKFRAVDTQKIVDALKKKQEGKPS